MKQDLLSQALLSSLMQGEDFFRFQVVDCLPSTNAALKALCRENPTLSEGLVLIAERQTQGHGRYDRVFSSPKGGIYMSILLRPTASAEAATLLTAAAAVAVAEAAEELTGLPFSIKWVNDIYRNGRKIAGILTEGSMEANGRLSYAVLGIGINVLPPEEPHPEALSSLVGRAFEEKEAPDNPRARLVAAVLCRLLYHYRRLSDKSFLEGYRSRSMLTGRTVGFSHGGCTQRGEVLGIDGDCRLLIKTEKGAFLALQSGEVQLTDF